MANCVAVCWWFALRTFLYHVSFSNIMEMTRLQFDDPFRFFIDEPKVWKLCYTNGNFQQTLQQSNSETVRRCYKSGLLSSTYVRNLDPGSTVKLQVASTSVNI